MQGRAYWSTRLGFYLATLGTAFGLGNVWRFPYVVGENGGGAFILLYVILAITVGLPLLISELILGKFRRRGVIEAVKSSPLLNAKKSMWIGISSLVVCLFVLSYYAVVSGWTLHFFIQFVKVTAVDSDFVPMSSLMKNGALQVSLASLHIVIAAIIVMKGLEKGLERIVSYGMPIFFLFLMYLMYQSLSLESATDALRFLFYPDFSKLSLASPLQALGHVCFTFSLGLGMMVTFGSYLRESDHIPTASVRVAFMDTLVSLFAGILVFPIVLSAAGIKYTDPGLLFQALPGFLLQKLDGPFFGALFFLCLYFAALAASLGLFEVLVSNFIEFFKWSRRQATWITGGLSLVFCLLPAMASSNFESVNFLGIGIFQFFDTVLINFFLPLLAVTLAFVAVKSLTLSEIKSFFIDEQKIESVVLFNFWRRSILWIIPGLFILFLMMALIGAVSAG